MKRRSFLGALVAAAVPLPPLPVKPTIVSWDIGAGASSVLASWVPAQDYIAVVHPAVAADLAPLMNGYIGRYEGVRFIESRV